MKSLKEQYKDTFNNIQLDDKKINENLYKIIRKDNKKRTAKRFNYALVNSIVIVFILIISVVNVVAHVDDIEKYFVNRDSKKIEVTFNKSNKMFDDNTFEDREKIDINSFQNKSKIKLLKPKNSNIDLTLWVSKNNGEVKNIFAWYEFDNSGWYFTDKYNIFAFRAYVSFEDDYIGEYECDEDDCVKNSKKLLLNNKNEILVFRDNSNSCEVKFMYENVYYTFNYSEYKFSQKMKNKETQKVIYDNILDFVDSMIEERS